MQLLISVLIYIVRLSLFVGFVHALPRDERNAEQRFGNSDPGLPSNTLGVIRDAAILDFGGLSLGSRSNILSPIEPITDPHHRPSKRDESKKGQELFKRDCADGESATTWVSWRPGPVQCAPDPEPDFTCEEESTMVFSDLVDGQIHKTCRTTPEREEEKEKLLWESVRPIIDIRKEQDKRLGDQAKEQADIVEFERRRSVRARRGACLALGAVTFLPQDDVKDLTDEEIEGMMEPDESLDSTLLPDMDLEDYMVTIAPKPGKTLKVYNDEQLTAGPPILMAIMSLIKIAASAAKVAKAARAGAVTPSMANRVFNAFGGKTGGQRFINLKAKAKTTKASQKAVTAARSSDRIKRILNSSTFQDCLALGAQLPGELLKAIGQRPQPPTEMKFEVGNNIVTIDTKAEKKDNHGSPSDQPDRSILMLADADEDARNNNNVPAVTRQTAPDNYQRGDSRLLYEACGSVGNLNNKITLIQVWGGCCRFYDGDNCEPNTRMFAMTDREDGELRGKHNDAIGSYWCTFDPGCAGSP